MSDQGAVLKRLKAWRNKYYAHWDKEYFLRPVKLSEHQNLKYGDLLNLTKMAAKILNDYSSTISRSSRALDILGTTDIDVILDILHKYKQAQKLSKNPIRHKKHARADLEQ